MNKISSKRIRKMIEIYKNTWINLSTTNCYAYALGLDVPEKEICQLAYQPGIMSGCRDLEEEFFTYNSLIYGIRSDLDFLRIGHREINPTDELSPDEWKIALFIPKEYFCPPYILQDYHFIKYYPDNTWHHKYGYTNNISNLDDHQNIIKNPKSCILENFVYDKTLALKLKK